MECDQFTHLEVHDKSQIITQKNVKLSKFCAAHVGCLTRTEASHLPASNSASSVLGSVPGNFCHHDVARMQNTLPCNCALISVIRSNASCERLVQSSASSTNLISTIEDRFCKPRRITCLPRVHYRRPDGVSARGQASHRVSGNIEASPKLIWVGLQDLKENGLSRGDILCVLAHASPTCRIFTFET